MIQLKYNDTIFANLLATPSDLEELIIGHLASEGYLEDFNFINNYQIHNTISDSGSFQITLHGDSKISARRHISEVVTTSCGACNTDGIDELIALLPILDIDDSYIDFDFLEHKFHEMKDHQLGFESSGGMHAAGLMSQQSDFLYVNEDIGRHNAVDKVIGHALLNQIDFSNTFLLLSGRCGWDIVAKASRLGIRNIVSIGACSSMAAETARILGIRVISFFRDKNAVIIGYNSSTKTASIET